MKMVFTALAAVAVAAAGATGSAAAVTGYDDAAAFAAAAGVLSTENFNDSSKFALADAVPIVFPGFSVTRAGESNFAGYTRVGTGQDPFNVNGTGQVFVIAERTSTLTLHFNTAITAFGATFDGYNNLDQSRLNVGGTLVNAGPSLDQGQRFFGLVSDTPFDTLDFVMTFPNSQGSDIFGFDNVFYGAAAAPGIPEPTSWAMLIIGFGVVGAMQRRRRAVVA